MTVTAQQPLFCHFKRPGRIVETCIYNPDDLAEIIRETQNDTARAVVVAERRSGKYF
jgi:hypothetical protein